MTRPALIERNGKSVYGQILAETESGLAFDPSQPIQALGIIEIRPVNNGHGLTVKRHFAETSTGATLGPHATPQKALEALLAWWNIHPAEIDQTSAPLF